MEHFNKLTPQELELLAVLSEECGEVVQVIGKILRHGLDSNWLDNPTNRQLLEEEIGDMYLAASLVVVSMLNQDIVTNRVRTKPKKLQKFLHHVNLGDTNGY